MARRRNRFIDQATADALVKYGPALSALSDLRSEALSEASTSIAAARSSGNHLQKTITAARPQIRSAYSGASKTAQQQAAIDATAVAALPADSPLKAAAALEQTGLQGRLAESRAAALTDLSQRSVAAKEGTRAAVSTARSKLASDLAKVLGREQSLAQEKGAFTATDAARLLSDYQAQQQALAIAAGHDATSTANSKRAARQSERNSERSAGINPDTGKPLPGRGPTGAKLKPGSSSSTALVGEAANFARTLRAAGHSRSEVAQTLQVGQKPQPVYQTVKTATGTKQQRVLNPDGSAKMTPAVPQVKDQLLLRVALDLAYKGYITKATRNALNRRGQTATSYGTVYWQPAARRIRRRTPRRGEIVAPGTVVHPGPPTPNILDK